MAKNICKFPLSTFTNELNTHRFVLETNQTTMKIPYKVNTHRLYLIEQGNAYFQVNEKSYTACKGTLFFIFENENVLLTQTDGVQFLYIDFSGTRANELLHRFSIYPATRKMENFHGLLPFWKESLSSANENNLDIATESVLLYTFSRLHKNATENGILQRIVEITEEHFQESELSISAIANEMGYNAKYLSHFFKQKMQTSYSEYLRSLRFQYAVMLFEHGIDSVKNVAYLSGFSDPLYFSNAFKKELGVSPKEYVQNLQNKRS